MSAMSSSAFLPAPLMALAEEFRATVGRNAASTDLAASLEYYYPVSVQYLTPLNTQMFEHWLNKKKPRLQLDVGMSIRPLFGCVISMRGSGFILIEEKISSPEQKYTLAHEFAHFLREHHAPRQRAIDLFGEGIREVLDGDRIATPSERLEAVLRGTSLRLFRHLMLRDDGGQPLAAQTYKAELDADLLALELIAPYRDLLAAIPEQGRSQQAFANTLINDYGLPAAIACRYATQLVAHFGPQPSLRKWLGIDTGVGNRLDQEERRNDG